MSWLFSRALAAEFLAAHSSAGKPFAPSNGIPTPLAYCAPDKMTVFSRLFRFGVTFKPLTENHGEVLLTWYLAGFRAKTSAQPGKARASTASDPVCGVTWHESSVRYDRDSRSWKTHQCLWAEDLPESLVTLPKWGMTRNGVVFQRPPLEHLTSVSVFGFSVPTPVSSDATSGAIIGKSDSYYTTGTGMPRKVNRNGKDGSAGLGRLVQMWPTQKSNDSKKGSNFDETNPRNGLSAAVMRWPTPVKSDAHARRPTLNWTGGDLPRTVWRSTGGQANPQMPPVQLNPNWVEWLMGWPLGWTDLKPLGTDKCHCAPPKLSESCPQTEEIGA